MTDAAAGVHRWARERGGVAIWGRGRSRATACGGSACSCRSPKNEPVAKSRYSAFTQTLADLGWTVGRNPRIDLRQYGDDINRIRALAQELVGLQPDIIVTATIAATVAVQRKGAGPHPPAHGVFTGCPAPVPGVVTRQRVRGMCALSRTVCFFARIEDQDAASELIQKHSRV
jgi:hypothetical protein